MKYVTKKEAYAAQMEQFRQGNKYGVTEVRGEVDVEWSLINIRPSAEMIRGILVDVHNKEIYECLYEAKASNAIAKAIGAHTIDAVYIVANGKEACAYVDDEGMLVEDNRHCYIEDKVIYGDALIVGTDRNGGDADSPLSLDEVRAIVSFDGGLTKESLFFEWLTTYAKEKNLALDQNFTFTIDDTPVFMSLHAILESTAMMVDYHEKVREQIAEIEFHNADPLHYFNFLGEIFAKINVSKMSRLFGGQETEPNNPKSQKL